MSESRTSKSIKNARVSLIYYCAQIILGFWSRKTFFDYLGTEILGLDTTASNVLSFLNLAEMGLGTAVGYFLYKPLFENDTDTINKIVTLQGWFYRRFACVIIVCALLVMCFFPWIFQGMKLPLWYAYATFLCMLVGTMLGYFLNYRQIVLGADQKIYKVTKTTQGAEAIVKIIQIVCLPLVSHPFLFYLLTGLISKIWGCFWLNRILKKEYPWLCNVGTSGRKLLEEYPEIIKKTKQLFIHGVSAVILFRVSPLIMYAYSSLTTIALYGNYLIITTHVSRLINMLFGSVGAAVGNLIASGDKKHIIRIFWELYDSRFCITTIILLCLYFLIQPFISIWLGSKYLLSSVFLTLMIIDTGIFLTRITVDQFINGHGLYHDIWAPIAEGIINFSAAIGFGYLFGYKGVLMASILSQGLIICIWKPFFLFSKGLKLSPWMYFIPVVKRLALMVINLFLLKLLFAHLITINISDYVEFIAYSSIVFFIVTILIFSEFIMFSQGIRDFIKRIRTILQHS